MLQTIHRGGPEGPSYQILTPDPNAAKPDWWLEQGRKLQLSGGPADINDRQLTIVSRRTWLHIVSSRRLEGFEMEWRVRHGRWTTIEGFIETSPSDLAAAFSLQANTSLDDPEYLARFGAEVGKVGCYIRRGPYLSLPNPGIGREGDSNLSVLVTPPIQEAVQRILIARGQ